MPTFSKSKAPRQTPQAAIDRLAAAIDALRAGRGVTIAERAEVTVYAAEALRPNTLKKLEKPALILSHARARTLKIRLYTPEIIALPIKKDMGVEDIRAIADPTTDLDRPMKGPFQALRTKLPKAYGAAVTLTKLAGLLPAAVVVKGGFGKGPKLSIGEITDYELEAAAGLSIVARARVPLEGAEKTELVAFRAADGAPENYAIVIGDPRDPVLTRMHSECFTGDLLGSLKCDCGPQLRGAITTIAKAGGGVVLYLAQEGRGIGLINKLRAYRLQDQGFDTIEANERLGFEADERVYAVAARMLSLLGFKKVRLLTNNPDKIAALDHAGIEVVERVPHAFPSNSHNAAYLRTKALKAGHLL
ncbi:GTP cyclohydrolase II [Rhizomicrobium palustre]|uniref:GTP cyclohydrolase-2 n=1 Tax=Rhizomicrobium palustre TaxID=189966 RepID=A0A846MXX6_9PROT|nr:GTP cyclohydrolase II [Rhizomicrobium palustre]NIK88099.1 GTP cyclohydrolase II [Rhizomicrobium palustre]